MIQEKKFIILLVEDDDFNYKYIYHIFLNTPFEIIRAKNGKDALTIFEENKNIDLILMDLKLPDINGIEIIKIIRRLNSQIPIICQTAARDDSISMEIISAGCNEVIIKPFSKEQLIKIIKNYIKWTD